MPRPEQQQQRRCEAITCLIPVGRLAWANFSRLSRREVARTSGRLGGARARARSPARCLLPPPSGRPGSRPVSRPRSLPPPASLLWPPPRGTGRGVPRNSDPEPLGLAQCPRGVGADRTQSRSAASACQSRPRSRPGAVASTPTQAASSPRGSRTAAGGARTAC